MKPHEPYKTSHADNNLPTEFPSQLVGVQLLHRYSPSQGATVWLIEYSPQKQNGVDISAGTYTLLTTAREEGGMTSCATRLCTLAENPSVLTVEAVSQDESKNHIWAAPIVAGTLNDLLTKQQKLPLTQVSWLAGKIAQGLDYYHQQSMGFSHLDASSCAFTADLSVVLLPPDRDNRGANEQVVQDQKRLDTLHFVELIWMCIQGKEAPEKHKRLPLNVLSPSISASTAELFEQVLEQETNMPDALEIAMALAQDAAPEVPPLHLSAPDASRYMIQPLKTAPTREKNMQKAVIQKRTVRLSSPLRSVQNSRKNSRKLPQKYIFLAALVGCLCLGAVLMPNVLSSDSRAVSGTQTIAREPSISAIPTETAEDAVLHIVQTILTQRNIALASGKEEEITSYAVSGSIVEKNDRQIIQESSESPISAQLILDSLDHYELEENTYTVQATLRADRELADSSSETDHIYLKDGVPHQQVTLIFKKVGENWLLEQAIPQATEGI